MVCGKSCPTQYDLSRCLESRKIKANDQNSNRHGMEWYSWLNAEVEIIPFETHDTAISALHDIPLMNLTAAVAAIKASRK